MMDLELNCFNSKQHHLLSGSAGTAENRGGDKYVIWSCVEMGRWQGGKSTRSEGPRLAAEWSTWSQDLGLSFSLYKMRRLAGG